MIVTYDINEVYPVYEPSEYGHQSGDVPDDLAARWFRVHAEWEKLQAEVGRIVDPERWEEG